MIEILGNVEFNLNLIGICVVFTAVVSLLVLLIVVAILGNVSQKKQAVAQSASEVTSSSAGTNLADDLELVAVITAAIAMQEKVSTDSFVVRSIRRRPSNKWS